VEYDYYDMKREHLTYLVCPECQGAFSIEDAKEEKERVKSGKLVCGSCSKTFPIKEYIPRFVAGGHYADSFGVEWNHHAKTQLDSVTGLSISRDRFFTQTKWPHTLQNELVLEVGGGAGRFTEVVVATGAMVVSVDSSLAVEANYESNGQRDNLLLVQAEMEYMPFRKSSFDKVFCLGVLQATPKPQVAFRALPPFVKVGGSLVVDIYKKSLLRRLLYTKHWIRPITGRMNSALLYKIIKGWVGFWWPLTRWITVFPKGRHVNRLVFFMADYTGFLPLSPVQMKEWAVLDTFDMLSPRYDSPATIAEVHRWFEDAGFHHIEAQYGYNGVEGRGVKS